MPSFEKTSSLCQGNLLQVRIAALSSMNAVQFFIGMHSEMFSVVAMCVSNKDHLPVTDRRCCDAVPKSNAVAETMSNLNFSVGGELPRQDPNRVKTLSGRRGSFLHRDTMWPLKAVSPFTWLPR
jgi:hypothetical protein